MIRILTLLLAIVLASPASATLSPDALARADIDVPRNAHLDLSMAARDSTGKLRRLTEIFSGRPAFFVFVDYTCKGVCGTELMLLTHALARQRITDASVIAFGIDAKDSGADAQAFLKSRVPPNFSVPITLLLPGGGAINRATTALGFHYVYDKANDQFAHPAAIYLLGFHGDVRRVFSPFELAAADLHKALAGAAQSQPLIVRQLHLLCYAYDPATGTYSAPIKLILKISAALTIIVLGFALLRMRSARRSSP